MNEEHRIWNLHLFRAQPADSQFIQQRKREGALHERLAGMTGVRGPKSSLAVSVPSHSALHMTYLKGFMAACRLSFANAVARLYHDLGSRDPGNCWAIRPPDMKQNGVWRSVALRMFERET